MKLFGPKKISCMGQKVPFWQFFRNRLIGGIGHTLFVQPSKTALRIFFSLFYIQIQICVFFFEYETIVRSSARSFGHSDPNPSSVVWSVNHASSHAILCFANCFKKMGGGIVCLLMTINVNYSFVRKISEVQGKETILKVRAKKYL